jgi:hypothetical protein
MDTYGHLFPSRERGWAAKLDDEGCRGATAPSAHPVEKVAERLSPKSRDLLVAVGRIERPTRGL